MLTKSDLRFVKSLYGGYWNYHLKDFCYMINPYFPPQEMLNEMAYRCLTLTKNYPSTNTYISSLISNYIKMDPANVVIANGASELIGAIGQLFVKRLAVPIPTFDEYVNRLRIQEKEVELYSIDEGFVLNTDSYIRFAEQFKANAVLFIRPNNPTGHLISKKELNSALERLADFDVVLVDESFIDFATSEENPSLEDYIDTYKNMIIIKSISKAYGIPGLRLGYAISGDGDRVSLLRKMLPIWNINSFAQFFIELLGDYQREFEDSCKKVVEATQMLYRELCNLKYIKPYPTEANFILCKLRHGISSTDVTEYLFNKHDILINDCISKVGLGPGYIRIGSRTSDENRELIDALRAWETTIE